ncbi:MAG: NUDIX hydrolase [Planctomycetota bacterium]
MNQPNDSTPSTEIQTLTEGRFLRMVKQGRWEYVERHTSTGAVAVVAVTEADELILVEQDRVPLGGPCIELPAGLAGDLDDAADESFIEAARRELLEETGYHAQHIEHLFEVATSPGQTSETIDLYRAQGLTRQHAGGGVHHEQITVHLIPVPEAAGWLNKQARAGKRVDIKTWLGVMLSGGDLSRAL